MSDRYETPRWDDEPEDLLASPRRSPPSDDLDSALDGARPTSTRRARTSSTGGRPTADRRAVEPIAAETAARRRRPARRARSSSRGRRACRRSPLRDAAPAGSGRGAPPRVARRSTSRLDGARARRADGSARLLGARGRGEGRAPRVGIVVARFNGDVTTALLESALAELDACGVSRDSVTVMPVPGAFELPLAAMALAKTRRFSCIVALGCVIRGDTPHFDYVSERGRERAAARGDRDGRARRVRRAHARSRRPGREPLREGRRGGAHRRSRWPTCSPTSAPLRPDSRHGATAGATRRAVPPRPRKSPGRVRLQLPSPAACPRSAHSAGRSPASATTGATRWSPPSAASTRTCSASG